jgi:hypothetical protein
MVVKRGQRTVTWRGEGRDWRGVSRVCGGFFCGVVVEALGHVVGWFWGGVCQVFEGEVTPWDEFD